MLVLSIFLVLKIILFMNGTEVTHDAGVILLLTSAISILIMTLVNNSKRIKNKKKWLGVFYTVISIIMLIDLMHYSYFGSLPSVKMLSQASQLTDVSDSVVELLTLGNLLMIIDLPFIYYYLFKYSEDKDFEFGKSMGKKLPIGLLAVVVLVYGVKMFNETSQSIKLQELYTFHSTDIKDFVSWKKEGSKGGISLEDEAFADGNEIFTNKDLEEYRDRSKLIEGELTGIGKDKNLIVLQIEAFQNFVVGMEYNGQEITPNVNKLIEDQGTIYYDNYFQLVGRGNTSDAEFVTNNSLHPSMETPTYDQFGENTFYGLPWVLKDNGYTPWAFHGYKKDFWNRANAYPNQGYERFLSEEDFDFDEEDIIGLGISDEKFFDQTIDYLKELKEETDNPFYAFVVSLTSHTPYDMPEKYHVLDIKKEHEGTIVGNYLQAIHYTDKYIGEFIERLKEEDMYDDSVIAMYGDHFAIQNTDEEVMSLMDDVLDKTYYYDDIMNIPLIIHVPNENINRTNSKVGSQIDFMPTILNIMGYKNQKGIMFGRDLNHYEGYTNVTPQTVMRKGSFIDDDVIFEVSRTELFDHSRVIDKKTMEERDIKKYRKIYDQAIKEINQSNFILKNNLFKSLLEGKWDVNEIELNELETFEKIDKFEFKKISDLDLAFDRVTEDSEEDSKEKENEEVENVFIFEINRRKDGNIFLNDNIVFEEVVEWAEKRENKHHAYLRVEDCEGEHPLSRLKFLYPESKADYIVEIDDFTQHYVITQYGYENIILKISELDYKDKDVLDFLNVHSLYGILIDEEEISENLLEELTEREVRLYKEDEDGIKLINK